MARGRETQLYVCLHEKVHKMYEGQHGRGKKTLQKTVGPPTLAQAMNNNDITNT